MEKNILITTSSFQVEKCPPLDQLVNAGFTIVVNPFGRKLTEQEIGTLLEQYTPIGMIAGVEPLTSAVIEKSEGLRVISRCGVGTDSVDLDAAHKKEISVTITPGGPTAAVSELTLSLMLDTCRRVTEADRNVRNGEWGALMGRLLASQTVGLIGFGRIGQAVGRLCLAFGATVIAFDPIGHSDNDIKLVPLDDLLEQADIVSLHVPLIDGTRGLMNAERISRMKKGGILINAARGGLVDEAALRQALDAGDLAAAALDCYEEEPYQGPLIDCPTAVLTAHMGSYAKEARALMEREAAENLLSQLRKIDNLGSQDQGG